MSYTLVKCLRSEYAVDWDIVERLCMSYHISLSQLDDSRNITWSESTWNPFRMVASKLTLPELTTVEVDWDKVRHDAQSACVSDMFKYSQNAAKDMPGIAEDVKWKVKQTSVNRNNFTNNLKDVQSANTTELQRVEDKYTGIIDVLQFIRDTSADVVTIGATIATGGAAVELLGTSSALKGIYKYQDTGKSGSAVLCGAGSMILGVFKISGAALIIVQGVLETGTSLLAGDTFARAIGKDALKIASAGSAQALFNASWVKTVFAKIPIPFSVFSVVSREGVNVMETDMADKLVEKGARKLAEGGTRRAFPPSDQWRPRMINHRPFLLV